MYLKIIPRLALILLLIAPSWARAETVLYSRNVYSLCTQEDMDWINFCNGLIQGYADYVVLAGASCIPAGTTRTTLITIFIDGFRDNFSSEVGLPKGGQKASGRKAWAFVPAFKASRCFCCLLKVRKGFIFTYVGKFCLLGTICLNSDTLPTMIILRTLPT